MFQFGERSKHHLNAFSLSKNLHTKFRSGLFIYICIYHCFSPSPVILERGLVFSIYFEYKNEWKKKSQSTYGSSDNSSPLYICFVCPFFSLLVYLRVCHMESFCFWLTFDLWVEKFQSTGTFFASLFCVCRIKHITKTNSNKIWLVFACNDDHSYTFFSRHSFARCHVLPRYPRLGILLWRKTKRNFHMFVSPNVCFSLFRAGASGSN